MINDEVHEAIRALLQTDNRPWSPAVEDGLDFVAEVYFSESEANELKALNEEARRLGFETEELGLAVCSRAAEDMLMLAVRAVGGAAGALVLANSAMKAAVELPDSWRKLRDKIRAAGRRRKDLNPAMYADELHGWLDKKYGVGKWKYDPSFLMSKRIGQTILFHLREDVNGRNHLLRVEGDTVEELPLSWLPPSLRREKPEGGSSMAAEFDVAVSYTELIDPGIVQPFLDEVAHEGVNVMSDRREEKPVAGVMHLMFPAITVWIADRYFGTMIQETAKAHYPKLKKAIVDLAKKTVGAGRSVFIRTVPSAGAPKKVAHEDADVLAIYSTLRTGNNIKFLFDHSITSGNLEVCVGTALTTLQAHHQSYPDDFVTLAIKGARLPARGLVVLKFDEKTTTWRLLGPMED